MNTSSLTLNHIEDIRLASLKMHGTERRRFLADITLKYCDGNTRRAETIFGWRRETIETGLGEKRTGIICLGAQSSRSGRKLWEERQPEAAVILCQIAEAHVQQDATFRTPIAFTRLTAAKALKQLQEYGVAKNLLPSPCTMAKVLNRMGYRLRRVVKDKPLKKIKETDAIFNNIKDKGQQSEGVKRLSMDIKATVNIGEYSRGGSTRGENKAADHDMGCKEKYHPFGIVDEDTGQLYITFGSSYKTSDFIVDALTDYWNSLTPQEQFNTHLIQIKIDNGPECSGVRTQFLNRMVHFSDTINTPIQLLYYPPYHSKYNPIERCWGVLELHWNGTLLTNVEKMSEWAKSMTWKGLHPVVKISKKLYKKGISLSKKAMLKIEDKLKRNPMLPKWDIFIQPV